MQNLSHNSARAPMGAETMIMLVLSLGALASFGGVAIMIIIGMFA